MTIETSFWIEKIENNGVKQKDKEMKTKRKQKKEIDRPEDKKEKQ